MSGPEGAERMDRTAAEDLLRGDRAALRPGHPVTAVLCAVTAPATARELAGEADAVAAFRAAASSVPAPSAPVRKRSAVRSTLAKLLTVEVLALTTVAFTGIGGVALATGAGPLPGPEGSAAPAAQRTSGGPPFVVPPVVVPAAPPRPSASAPATVVRLCEEFDERDRHEGEALDDDRFDELVRRAGRRDHDDVARYCDSVARRRDTDDDSRDDGFRGDGHREDGYRDDSSRHDGFRDDDGYRDDDRDGFRRDRDSSDHRFGERDDYPGGRLSTPPSGSSAPNPRPRG